MIYNTTSQQSLPYDLGTPINGTNWLNLQQMNTNAFSLYSVFSDTSVGYPTSVVMDRHGHSNFAYNPSFAQTYNQANNDKNIQTLLNVPYNPCNPLNLSIPSFPNTYSLNSYNLPQLSQKQLSYTDSSRTSSVLKQPLLNNQYLFSFQDYNSDFTSYQVLKLLRHTNRQNITKIKQYFKTLHRGSKIPQNFNLFQSITN